MRRKHYSSFICQTSRDSLTRMAGPYEGHDRDVVYFGSLEWALRAHANKWWVQVDRTP